MDAPNDDEERREPVSRSLSPALLDSHSWAGPPLSSYNQPHYHPSLYDIPVRYTSYPNRPIRPFRIYNYLDSQGEDLASRQYTLGPDNMLELNEPLTAAYRQAAQHASRHLQFTSVYVPSEHWNPHEFLTEWLSGDDHSPTDTPPNHTGQVDAEDVNMPAAVASSSRQTLDMLPPSPNQSRSSPELSVADSGSGSKRQVRGRRRRSTVSDHSTWTCEPCNKTFPRRHEYARHLRTAKAHQEEGRYKCRFCGNGFTRQDATDRHERETCEKNARKEKGAGKGKGKKGKGKEKDGDIEEF